MTKTFTALKSYGISIQELGLVVHAHNLSPRKLRLENLEIETSQILSHHIRKKTDDTD